jgi:hypothetical protein
MPPGYNDGREGLWEAAAAGMHSPSAMDGAVRIALLESEVDELRRRDAERTAELAARERRIRLLEEALRILQADRYGASREKLTVAPVKANSSKKRRWPPQQAHRRYDERCQGEACSPSCRPHRRSSRSRRCYPGSSNPRVRKIERLR